MKLTKDLDSSATFITRRRVLAGLAIGIAGIASSSRSLSDTPGAMKEAPSTPGNKERTSIHQEIDFKVAPDRLYNALLDSKQFTVFSGLPAEIDPKEGGAFSMFGGLIVGRNVELVPNQRVVQAWRPGHWDAGVYSIVKFELKPNGAATTIIFDHKGFPEGDYDSLLSGWNGHYWHPLEKYLL
jgi:activator of HSP90 ATPase